MSKTVTLRLSDDAYQLFRQSADDDNRSLANFIETATKRFIEHAELANESETAEIRRDAPLNRRIRRGQADARAKRGRFVD